MTQLTVLPLPTDEPRADVLLFPDTHANRTGQSVTASGSDDTESNGNSNSPPARTRRQSGVVTRDPNDAPSRVRPLHAVKSHAPEADRRLVELVRDQHRTVWRTLRRLGVPLALVDDATQEVFIIAARKLEFIEPGALRSFVYGTALRVAANFRRSRQAKGHDVLEDNANYQNSEDTEQLVQQKQLRELLDRILDTMSDDLREVFVLFELEKLTRVEIADLLGLPSGTIASRLRRAREHFEDACQKLRAFPQGGAR